MMMVMMLLERNGLMMVVVASGDGEVVCGGEGVLQGAEMGLEAREVGTGVVFSCGDIALSWASGSANGGGCATMRIGF